MSGGRNMPADALGPAHRNALRRPVIPWPLGFAPLLFLGDCILILARRADRDILS
ncbi:hypothetical protein NT2_06_01890 [Caenibius tardaugens NBRC 16725]|uniref:Uncharacterized protein n=1 Tax=Caenibius tardaugens NBRC 16725 TaxID=1219035 RepID=U2ZWK1_9SPHN|nr:hypothetical protein NT2_06_01890 [Caenibius tardaugens NBRC 16725]